MSTGAAWSPPHNWCDRRCERCPIASTCGVHVACTRRRAERVARGDDPDSPEAILEGVVRTLESAVRMAEQMGREAGIEIERPLAQPPVVLDGVRVQRVGERVARALAQVHAPADATSEPLAEAADETIALWSLLVAKAARVFSYTVDFDPDIWARDAEPNLLLIQRVRDALSCAFDQLQREWRAGSIPDDVWDGVEHLDRLLSPLFDCVNPSAQLYLEVLIAQGLAPSPFVARD